MPAHHEAPNELPPLGVPVGLLKVPHLRNLDSHGQKEDLVGVEDDGRATAESKLPFRLCRCSPQLALDASARGVQHRVQSNLQQSTEWVRLGHGNGEFEGGTRDGPSIIATAP